MYICVCYLKLSLRLIYATVAYSFLFALLKTYTEKFATVIMIFCFRVKENMRDYENHVKRVFLCIILLCSKELR